MKIFLTIVSLFVLTSITTAKPPEDRWLYGSAGYARALELQRELNVPLVVYFYVDWCPYCHALDNEYLPTPPVQQYLREVVKVRINPEHGPAEREIANRYGVRGYPAFFIMRTASSPPRKVHPFRRSGANLTPDEFASLCRQGSFDVTPTGTNSAIRQTTKAQIVEVTPSRKSPTAGASRTTVYVVQQEQVRRTRRRRPKS